MYYIALPVILPATIKSYNMSYKSSIPIGDIRSQCRKVLKANGSKQVTITNYKCSLGFLISFMEKEKISDYTVDVGIALMRHVRYVESFSCDKRNNIYKCVKLLNFIIGDLPSPLRRPGRISYEYASTYKELIEQFVAYYTSLGKSEHTISVYSLALSRFSVAMKMKGKLPSTFTRLDLVDFFSNVNMYKTPTVTAIKYFCMYLHHEGVQKDDYNSFFKAFGIKRAHERIVSVYSPDEIMSIENAVNRNTEIGKRDYAMILLASRLGLRSSDIRGLRFDNIDWDKNTINLIQFKTQKRLCLPLLKDVGEALVDYITNSRPNCNHKRIFLTHDFPYDGIGEETLHRIVTTYIQKAKIPIGERRHGPHALRHSLATQLLFNGEILPTISDVLGHSSTETTKGYLSVDIKSLIHCSLSVPLIDENFYTQGGGLFYDYD